MGDAGRARSVSRGEAEAAILTFDLGRHPAMLGDARALYMAWMRSELIPQLKTRGFRRRADGWSKAVDGNALVVLLEARSRRGIDLVEVRVSYGMISTVGSPDEANSHKMPGSIAWTVQYGVGPADDGSPWEVTDAASIEVLRIRLLPELLSKVDELARGGATDRNILQVLRFGATGGSVEFLRLLSAFRIASALHDSDAAEWAASDRTQINTVLNEFGAYAVGGSFSFALAS